MTLNELVSLSREEMIDLYNSGNRDPVENVTFGKRAASSFSASRREKRHLITDKIFPDGYSTYDLHSAGIAIQILMNTGKFDPEYDIKSDIAKITGADIPFIKSVLVRTQSHDPEHGTIRNSFERHDPDMGPEDLDMVDEVCAAFEEIAGENKWGRDLFAIESEIELLTNLRLREMGYHTANVYDCFYSEADEDTIKKTLTEVAKAYRNSKTLGESMETRIQRLREGKTLNPHTLHIEDSFLKGKESLTRMMSFFNYLYGTLEGSYTGNNPPISQKIDGGPVINIWTSFNQFPGPGVAGKGLFNKTPVYYTSDSQIDASDKPEGYKVKLKAMLKLAQTGIIPEGQIWMGDMLWSKGDAKTYEKDGEKLVYVKPVTIVYAAPYDSDLGKKMLNCEVGIVFHTRYTNSLDNKTNDISIDELNGVPEWAFVKDAQITNLAGKVSFTKQESAVIKEDLDELQQLVTQVINREDYEELCSNESFVQFYIMTLQNHKVDEQTPINPQEFVKELHDWVDTKINKERSGIASLKTEAGRLKKGEALDTTAKELHFLVEENAPLISEIAEGLALATQIKADMIEKINEADEWISQVEMKDGFHNTAGEGFVVSDTDGNFVKLVDRSAFSFFGRSPDIIKGAAHSQAIKESRLREEEEEDLDLEREEQASIYNDDLEFYDEEENEYEEKKSFEEDGSEEIIFEFDSASEAATAAQQIEQDLNLIQESKLREGDHVTQAGKDVAGSYFLEGERYYRTKGETKEALETLVKKLSRNYSKKSFTTKIEKDGDKKYYIVVDLIKQPNGKKVKISKKTDSTLNAKEKTKAKIKAAPPEGQLTPKNDLASKTFPVSYPMSELCFDLNKKFVNSFLFWHKNSPKYKIFYKNVAEKLSNEEKLAKEEAVVKFLTGVSSEIPRSLSSLPKTMDKSGGVPSEAQLEFLKANVPNLNLEKLANAVQKFNDSDTTIIQEYLIGKIISIGLEPTFSSFGINVTPGKGKHTILTVKDLKLCMSKIANLLKETTNIQTPGYLCENRINSFLEGWSDSFGFLESQDEEDEKRDIKQKVSLLYKSQMSPENFIKNYALIHPSHIDETAIMQLSLKNPEEITVLEKILDKRSLNTEKAGKLNRDTVLPADIYFLNIESYKNQNIKTQLKKLAETKTVEEYIIISNELFRNQHYIPISLKKNIKNTYDISIIYGDLSLTTTTAPGTNDYFSDYALTKRVYFELGKTNSFSGTVSEINEQTAGADFSLQTSKDGHANLHCENIKIMLKKPKKITDAMTLEATPDPPSGAKIGRFVNGLKSELKEIGQLEAYMQALKQKENDDKDHIPLLGAEESGILRTLGTRTTISLSDDEINKLYDLYLTTKTEKDGKTTYSSILPGRIFTAAGLDSTKFNKLEKQKITAYLSALRRLQEKYELFNDIYYSTRLREQQTEITLGKAAAVYADFFIDYLSGITFGDAKKIFPPSKQPEEKSQEKFIVNMTCLLARAAKYPLLVNDEFVTKIADHVKIS